MDSFISGNKVYCSAISHGCVSHLHACFCYSMPLVDPGSDPNDINWLLKSDFCDLENQQFPVVPVTSSSQKPSLRRYQAQRSAPKKLLFPINVWTSYTLIKIFVFFFFFFRDSCGTGSDTELGNEVTNNLRAASLEGEQKNPVSLIS